MLFKHYITWTWNILTLLHNITLAFIIRYVNKGSSYE